MYVLYKNHPKSIGDWAMVIGSHGGRNLSVFMASFLVKAYGKILKA